MLCCCSVAQWCPTICEPMDCSAPDFPGLHYILEFTQTLSIELMMPSNHLTLCHPLFSCPQPLPASGSFPVSQLFPSGSQSIGASASASVLPITIQDWFPLGLTGLISLQSKGLSRVFSNTAVQKHQFFGTQPSLWSLTSVHDYWENYGFDYPECCRQSESLLFNTLSTLVITFLPRSKCLLISWLQSPPAVILELPKINPDTVQNLRCYCLCIFYKVKLINPIILFLLFS